MAIKDSLLVEFDHEMGTTRRLLERLPDDRLAWRPHPRSRTLGELATHLTGLPNWGARILSADEFDLADLPSSPSAALTSRAAIVDAFDACTKTARGMMDRTDAEYQGRWTLRRGGAEVFSMPRAAVFRSFVINHTIHHRGQLSVYLRLNEVLVPAIYGPTADES